MTQRADFCPYVGLQPFTEEHHDYFFGREREIKIISANLYASHVTILYGPSGAGKSSVLRAGVIPHLAQAPRTAVVYFNSWHDENFLDQLKAALVSAIETRTTKPVPHEFGLSLDELLHSVAEAYNGAILFILDQFEEYFVYHPESGDRTNFEAELASAVNSEDVDASFLIALREDWLASLQRFDVRIPNLFGNQLRVGPLSRAAAHDAIRKPLDVYNRLAAPAAGMSIDDDLVQALVDQASGVALPGDTGGAGQITAAESNDHVEPSILQLVMVRLWREETHAGSQLLTLRRFQELGGARQIGEEHLTAVLDRFSETEREIADRAFRYLVMPQGNKIAQTTENLVLVAEHPELDVKRTLAALTDSRILSRSYPPERYEITHDVLCPAVLDWRRKRARIAAERRAEQEARAAKRFRRLSVALGAMFVIASITAVVAWSQWMQSRSRELASEAAANLPTDPERSIVRALEALATWHTREAEESLHRSLMTSRVRLTLEGHSKAVRRIAIDPTDTRIATGSLDGSVKLWDARSGKLLRSLENAHTGGVLAVAFAPDGCCLASAGMDNAAKIWELGSEREPIILTGHGKPVADIAFNAGQVVTASSDGTVRFWDTRSGNTSSTIAVGTPVNAIAFGPDGRLLATGSGDQYTKIWEVRTRRLIKSIPAPSIVQAVAFSPDGTRAAVASGRTLYLWDTQTWSKVAERSGHTGTIFSIAFSRNGRWIATSSLDSTARLWPAGSEGTELTFAGHRDSVQSVAFSADGSLLTAGEDTTARIWTTGPAGESLTITVPTEALTSVAYSPDGGRLVSPGTVNTAVIWDATTGQPIHTLAGHTADVLDACFSPNAQQVATGSRDGTVRLWNAATGQEVQSLFEGNEWVSSVAFDPSGKWLAAGAYPHAYVWNLAESNMPMMYSQHTDRVNQLVFSSDGTRIASASSDSSVQVWAAGTRALQSKLTDKRNFYTVNFLLDSDTVVAGANDGTLTFWNFQHGRLDRTIPAHSGIVHKIAIAPSVARIATAGDDKFVHLWDTRSGNKLLTLFGHDGEVRALAFSPDGTRLATAAGDGAIRIFILDIRTLAEFAQTRVTRGELREQVNRAFGHSLIAGLRRLLN